MVNAGYVAWNGTVWKEPVVAQFEVPSCHVLEALRKTTKPSIKIVCVAQITKGHKNYHVPRNCLASPNLRVMGDCKDI
jgi:hypothetical protein